MVRTNSTTGPARIFSSTDLLGQLNHLKVPRPETLVRVDGSDGEIRAGDEGILRVKVGILPAQLKVLVHQLCQGGPVPVLQGDPEGGTASVSLRSGDLQLSDQPGSIGELGERPHRLDHQRFPCGDTGVVTGGEGPKEVGGDRRRGRRPPPPWAASELWQQDEPLSQRCLMLLWMRPESLGSLR